MAKIAENLKICRRAAEQLVAKPTPHAISAKNLAREDKFPAR